MFDVLLLIFTLLILIFGAWCVGEGGEILGEKYDASFIGGFVIAWLNTAPETLFFISALNSGNIDIAIGAMSGSVIVVSTIAVGIALFIGASARRTKSVEFEPAVRQQALALGISLVPVALMIVIGFSLILGIFGILEYMGFAWFFLRSKEQLEHEIEDDLRASSLENAVAEDSDDEEVHKNTPVWHGAAYLIVGGVIFAVFSDFFIDAVTAIGVAWRINAVMLAFFLAPIASEAPEILEAIQLSRKGRTKSINVAFSNLMGGTVSKTTLLLGILHLYGALVPHAWITPIYPVSIACVVICCAFTAWLGHHFQRHPAVHGLYLLVPYLFSAAIQGYLSFEGNGKTASQ